MAMIHSGTFRHETVQQRDVKDAALRGALIAPLALDLFKNPTLSVRGEYKVHADVSRPAALRLG